MASFESANDAMTASATTLTASDLFALLDRDFRRRTKSCAKCHFSLPYRVFGNGNDAGDWTVVPSELCSHPCESILEDVVSRYRSAYRASDTGRFHVR